MAKRKPPGRAKGAPHEPKRPKRPNKSPGKLPGKLLGKLPGRRPTGPAGKAGGGDRYWLYGWHAVRAALANPARTILDARATPEAQKRLEPEARASLEARGVTLDAASRAELDALLPAGAVHQGVALDVQPLAPPALADWLERIGLGEAADPRDPAGSRPVLVALDQVSDPHNVGAVLRSAAAFGALAVLAPRHGQAPETGALAKAASGALDVVPYIDAGNFARALGTLKKRGFWILGLAGEANQELAAADPGGPLVLVLGGEGRGLRRLTREACDLMACLPTRPPIDQLNVSNAAAVALYELLGREG
jgi:23S rRNA (guanosine2251-2'-O)-methyltransferase